MNFQKKHFKLIMYFWILVIILSVLVYYIKENLEIEKLNTIETNLLLVQAKINNIKVNSQVNNSNLLVGKNVTEYENSNFINELIDKHIISQDESYKYYVFDKNTLYEIELGDAILENNEYILVNYETGEILLSKPFIYKKNEYYKLSEIKQIER